MLPDQHPRLRDLPPYEREVFGAWLLTGGHTRPIDDDTEPRSEWDWYYPIDYAAWQAGVPARSES